MRFLFAPDIEVSWRCVCAKIVNEALGKMHCIQWSETVCGNFSHFVASYHKKGKQNQFSDTKLIFHQSLSQISMKRPLATSCPKTKSQKYFLSSFLAHYFTRFWCDPCSVVPSFCSGSIQQESSNRLKFSNRQLHR